MSTATSDVHGWRFPDVVMVLENCYYPLDSRVRNEAESLVESRLTVEVLAPGGPFARFASRFTAFG